MSIAIIANPSAGRGRGAKTAELAERILTEKNQDYELVLTKQEGHAVELAAAAARKHETVVALGGDGTIREVLAGVHLTKSTLGIIPSGTGNDYARGLNIPRQTIQAIEVLLNGQRAELDIGMENDRVFGVLASIGFPVAVIEYVNQNRDGFLQGKPAFLTAVVATLKNLKSFPAIITVDGKRLKQDIIGLFIMNMPYGGGGMKFTPDACYNDGLFNVLLIGEVSGFDLAVTLPKIYSGNHVNHPAVRILTGREIKVESEQQTIMLDGDIFAPRTIHAKILPKALQIIKP